MRYINAKSLLWLSSFLFLQNQVVQAQSTQLNSIQSTSSTYLVCYYRDKVTGQTSWEWGKDANNQDMQIDGQWTDTILGAPTAGAMLKINGAAKDFEPNYASACTNTNKDITREYAEYGVSNSSLDYKHQIWFEQISPNSLKYPFSRFVVFGDSLSDNGNLYNYSHAAFVTGSYYMGRFSNGPVWAEYLATQLHLDLYDWAVSGVTTDIPIPVPYTMDNQVDNYTSVMTHVANPAFDQSLYVILIGANNYIFGVDANPANIVNNISASMEKLISAGARYFIVPTLPDISFTPLVSSEGKEAQQAMRSKVSLHNQLLAAALAQIKVKYPFINLLIPDVDVFLNNVIAAPVKFGVLNVTDKCDTGLPLGSYNTSTFCDKPREYLFWDFVHPTTKVHCEMAQDIMVQLSQSYGDEVVPYQKDYSQCDLSYVNKR